MNAMERAERTGFVEEDGRIFRTREGEVQEAASWMEAMWASADDAKLPEPRPVRRGKAASSAQPLPRLIEVDQLQALGIAEVTSLGDENIYLTREGQSYYCKVGNTECYAQGPWDFRHWPDGLSADAPKHVAAQIAAMTGVMATGDVLPSASLARQALQSSGFTAKPLANSNTEAQTTPFCPSEAFVMADGSVYEITLSGANAYAGIQVAARDRAYIADAVAGAAKEGQVIEVTARVRTGYRKYFDLASYVEKELESGLTRFEDQLLAVVFNPIEAPLDCGYEIIGKRAGAGVSDNGYALIARVRVFDEALLQAAADRATVKTYGQNSPFLTQANPTACSALIEVLVRCNDSPALPDFGIELEEVTAKVADMDAQLKQAPTPTPDEVSP